MLHAKVILIGGTPGAGNSTLAREVARRLHITSISIDDLLRATQGVTTPESHPGLHVMRMGDHLTYFTSTPAERLITDASEQHEATWPAVERVVRPHSSLGNPTPMEYVEKLEMEGSPETPILTREMVYKSGTVHPSTPRRTGDT